MQRVFKSFTRASICSPKYSCEQVQHQHFPRRHHITFAAAWFVYKLDSQCESLHNNTCRSLVSYKESSLKPRDLLRYTDQRWVRPWQILASSNECLNLKFENSEWTEASHHLQGQGGTSSNPKQSTYEQKFMPLLGPPSRDAQGQQRLQAQGASEASTCQVQILSTTKISGVPQQQVPNYIQPRNPFQESSLVGQLLFAFSNKFFSRSCNAGTGSS